MASLPSRLRSSLVERGSELPKLEHRKRGRKGGSLDGINPPAEGGEKGLKLIFKGGMDGNRGWRRTQDM